MRLRKGEVPKQQIGFDEYLAAQADTGAPAEQAQSPGILEVKVPSFFRRGKRKQPHCGCNYYRNNIQCLPCIEGNHCLQHGCRGS